MKLCASAEETKIAEPNDPAGIDQNVLRRDIAVDELERLSLPSRSRVGMIERSRNAVENVMAGVGRKHDLSLPHELEKLRQCRPHDAIHDEEREVAVAAHVVRGDDRGMLEQR